MLPTSCRLSLFSLQFKEEEIILILVVYLHLLANFCFSLANRRVHRRGLSRSGRGNYEKIRAKFSRFDWDYWCVSYGFRDVRSTCSQVTDLCSSSIYFSSHTILFFVRIRTKSSSSSLFFGCRGVQIVFVGVWAPLDICLQRIKERDASKHLAASTELITKVVGASQALRKEKNINNRVSW